MSRARTLANYVSSGVSAAEFDYMDGVTSNVQTQINNAGATGGISDGNHLEANANVADNDFLRVDGTEIEGRTAAETLSDIGGLGASNPTVTLGSGATFPAQHIIKIKSTTKTDNFTYTTPSSYSSDTFVGGVAITGLNVVTDVPSDDSSKFFIMVSIGIFGSTGGITGAFHLFRTPAGGSATEIGQAVTEGVGSSDRQGSITRAIGYVGDANHSYGASFTYLDSPASSVALTYQVNLRGQSGPNVVYIGRSGTFSGTNDSYGSNCASTITVMELAG